MKKFIYWIFSMVSAYCGVVGGFHLFIYFGFEVEVALIGAFLGLIFGAGGWATRGANLKRPERPDPVSAPTLLGAYCLSLFWLTLSLFTFLCGLIGAFITIEHDYLAIDSVRYLSGVPGVSLAIGAFFGSIAGWGVLTFFKLESYLKPVIRN